MKQCTIRTIQSIHEVQIQVSLRVSFAYINMHVAKGITLYRCYHVYGNRLKEFTKKDLLPSYLLFCTIPVKTIFHKRLETNIRVYEETVYKDN